EYLTAAFSVRCDLQPAVFCLFAFLAPSALYALSLHDALPISAVALEIDGAAVRERGAAVEVAVVAAGVVQRPGIADRPRVEIDRSEEHTAGVQSRRELACRVERADGPRLRRAGDADRRGAVHG